MAVTAQIPGGNLHKQFRPPPMSETFEKKGSEAPSPDIPNISVLYRDNSPAAFERPTKKSSNRKQVPKSHRNRYRDSDNLKRGQVDEFVRAATFAGAVGLHLKASVTIAWNHTKYQLTGRHWKKCSKRLNRLISQLGVTPAFIYVHENPGNEYPNTHLLIHRGKISLDKLAALLADAFGALDDVAIKVIPRHSGSLNYLIKGASQQTNRAYGRNRVAGGQGTINFKRSGTTQNIGQSARKGA